MIISLTQIIPWLLHYRYYVILPIAMVEGPIVTVIAGFLSSLGQINIWAAYFLIVMGDLVGDTVLYAIGRWGQLSRWGYYIGVTTSRIENLKKHFEHHSGKTLILGKLGHGIGGLILVAAGVAHVPYKDFIWFNFVSTLPKSVILLLIGFYFGSAYLAINNFLNYSAVGMIALSIVLLVAYVLIRRFSKRLLQEDSSDI